MGNSKLRTDLPKQAVYRIWSQTRDRAYVGSSMNLPGRYNDHLVSIGLGGIFEIVYVMNGASKKEVLQKEDELILEMRAQGVQVINPTNKELCQARGRATMAKHGSRMAEAMRTGRWNLGPEKRSQIQRDAWANFTPEERSEIRRKDWAKRRTVQ